MRSTEDVNRVMETYADMVQRICFVHLKNRHDTEVEDCHGMTIGEIQNRINTCKGHSTTGQHATQEHKGGHSQSHGHH